MSGLESLLTGRVLVDRYRIEAVIGRGGMGAVYRARDERLGRAVAVKVITVSAPDEPTRARIRARFRHEAASAARLPHHPNVVPVYDYGTDPDLRLDFLVMELLRGEDLASRLGRHGPPPLPVALRILLQAARGVAVGHRAGLVHRDVKPGNVFLMETDEDAEMQVRILDFGIAKAIATEEDDTGSQLTHDGRAPLSPAYASPEQLRGEPALSPASDVFSLGALGYLLLSGDRPFTEPDRVRMTAGMDVPLPSLRARAPHVPEAVEALIRRALAPTAAERFATAGVFADALQRTLLELGALPAEALLPPVPVGRAPVADDRTMLEGTAMDDDRTMLAPPPPPPRAAGGPAIAPPRRLETREVEPRPGGGKKVVLWSLLALLLVGGGATAAWLASGGGDAPREDRPLSELSDTAMTDTTVVDVPDQTDALAADLEGRRYLTRGEYPTALEFFRKAMEISPDNVEYRDRYAFTLIRMGRHAEAARALEDAVRINPAYDLLHSHLGNARLATGDTTGAVESFREYLNLSTDRQGREQVQRLLDVLLAPAPVVVPAPPIDTVAPQPQPQPDTLSPAPADTLRLRR